MTIILTFPPSLIHANWSASQKQNSWHLIRKKKNRCQTYCNVLKDDEQCAKNGKNSDLRGFCSSTTGVEVITYFFFLLTLINPVLAKGSSLTDAPLVLKAQNKQPSFHVLKNMHQCDLIKNSLGKYQPLIFWTVMSYRKIYQSNNTVDGLFRTTKKTDREN